MVYISHINYFGMLLNNLTNLKFCLTRFLSDVKLMLTFKNLMGAVILTHLPQAFSE